MRFLNFGSLNTDHVYTVDAIVQPGQTITSTAFSVDAGGKGLNQSVALARAGGRVFHAGATGGGDADMLMNILEDNGVDVSFVDRGHVHGGRAIIQVDRNGQNCIVLFAGANREITPDDVRRVIADFGAGDALVLQNETSCLDEMIRFGRERGMRICLNPSPADARVDAVDLNLVDYLILNEIEGEYFTGRQDEDAIAEVLIGRYPSMRVVLTLGGKGSLYADAEGRSRQDIFEVPVVNTTAAGDAFTGFFLTSLFGGKSPPEALRTASAAAALAVSRRGAADSIPTLAETEQFLADSSR